MEKSINQLMDVKQRHEIDFNKLCLSIEDIFVDDVVIEELNGKRTGSSLIMFENEDLA